LKVLCIKEERRLYGSSMAKNRALLFTASRRLGKEFLKNTVKNYKDENMQTPSGTLYSQPQIFTITRLSINSPRSTKITKTKKTLMSLMRLFPQKKLLE
jgi:hypothetical protein